MKAVVISDIHGSGYYADTIDGVRFSMNGTYTTTTATYWTSSTNNTVQPIVVIERTPQVA